MRWFLAGLLALVPFVAEAQTITPQYQINGPVPIIGVPGGEPVSVTGTLTGTVTGGGQTQVRDAANANWVNVGPAAPNVHMPVDVLNTPAVTVNGPVSTNATIVGTPTVNSNSTIVGTPSVNVANTPSVNATIVGTPTVNSNATIVGTPTVNCGNCIPAPVVCNNSTAIDVSAIGATQLIAPVAGKTTYICAFETVAFGTVNANFVSADASCATPVAMEGPKPWVANTGDAHGSGMGMLLKTPADKGVCLNLSAAVRVTGSVTWAQQ